MKSFSRVVQSYIEAAGGGGGDQKRRICAQWARADLADLFSRRNWRFYERTHEETLWGTETVTISSVSGTLATITGATDNDWVDQDIVLGGSPYRIVAINTSGTGGSLRIYPTYGGSAVAPGTSATIRQVRIDLPTNFGSMLDFVQRGSSRSYARSPSVLTELLRRGGLAGNSHAIQGDKLLIWPTGSERLFFRYSYLPANPYEYGEGSATVLTRELDLVNGSGTQWKILPKDMTDAVFETTENITRGHPQSFEVSAVLSNTSLRLLDNFNGTLDTAFDYKISTDLDLPGYMDAWVYAKADWRAGKRDEGFVERTYQRAASADHPSDEAMQPGFQIEGALAYVTPVR